MITTFEHKQPTLEAAQEMVGGMVEMVRSPTNPDIQILVNEEGLLKVCPSMKKQLSYVAQVSSGMQ